MLVVEIDECTLFLIVLSFMFVMSGILSLILTKYMFEDCENTGEACLYFENNGIHLGLGLISIALVCTVYACTRLYK